LIPAILITGLALGALLWGVPGVGGSDPVAAMTASSVMPHSTFANVGAPPSAR
jgi:hypothetical protein